jgi:hypothetical protein
MTLLLNLTCAVKIKNMMLGMINLKPEFKRNMLANQQPSADNG